MTRNPDPANPRPPRFNPCQKPAGLLGRLVLRLMNARHAAVTDWGLSHVPISARHSILDVGCGGGRTLAKLAEIASAGKVYGVDHSEQAVAASARVNARSIDAGRVEVRLAEVSNLPFPAVMFDLVTAVETHFWWPDLAADMREVFRVVKPGGTFVAIAEIYKGAATRSAALSHNRMSKMGMTLLSADEHRGLFERTGYSNVRVVENRGKGWICAIGTKS